MKYTIERDDYHDKNGKITKTAVYIKYRKSFFGLFTYWKYITHRDCGMSDCYDARTNFSTQEKAENFIKEILCLVTSTSTDKNILRKIEHAYLYNHIQNKKCINK